MSLVTFSFPGVAASMSMLPNVKLQKFILTLQGVPDHAW